MLTATPGDMTKPIYRHLASKKWHAYKRLLLVQRITQMNVTPDVLPSIDPSVSTSLSFGKRKVPHGEIVDSRVSEIPPTLTIQPYDRGERLYTIAVIDPDIPNVTKDAFDYRCHFLAANIPISPTSTTVNFAALDRETQLLIPWLPPFSQKGLKYERLAIFILEQPRLDPLAPVTSGQRSSELDVPGLKRSRYAKRENFILRSLVGVKNLTPVGVDLFRTQWDEGTAGVMQRAGVVGWDVEFKRKRIEPLPYKRLGGGRYR
jgi:large subunit ribosomal protein L35